MGEKPEARVAVMPPVNDNDWPGRGLEIKQDQHVCLIARAIGHHMARQHYSAWEKKQRRAANDNSPATLGEEIEGQGPKG
ncbi:Transposase [Thalassospira profundimaris]